MEVRNIIFYYGSLKRFAKNYVTHFFLPNKKYNAFEMSQSGRNEKWNVYANETHSNGNSD